jgi:hypothetical protein
MVQLLTLWVTFACFHSSQLHIICSTIRSERACVSWWIDFSVGGIRRGIHAWRRLWLQEIISVKSFQTFIQILTYHINCFQKVSISKRLFPQTLIQLKEIIHLLKKGYYADFFILYLFTSLLIAKTNFWDFEQRFDWNWAFHNFEEADIKIQDYYERHLLSNLTILLQINVLFQR